MKVIRILSISAIVAITAGCAIVPEEPHKREDGAIDAISNTSDIQTTIIKKHGDPERYCAARQSDVADTRSVGASIGVNNAAYGADSIGEGSSQGALALGGRSPAVLIVRELMYRACELSLNLNADPKETLEIYKFMLQSANDIASLTSGPGSAALGEGASSSGVKQASTASSSSSDDDSDDDDDSTEDEGVD